MKNIYSILFFSAIIFLGCQQLDPNKQIDEGNIKEDTYKSDAVGWTIDIPKGWKIMTKDKIENLTEKGEEAIKKVGTNVDYSGLKHLINFQKDQFNVFQSSIEAAPDFTKEDWINNNLYVKHLLYSTYLNQGIKIDTSSSKKMVDGIEFEVFNVKVYSSKGEVVLNQIMHSAFINGYDFAVNVNYNNENDKNELMSAFENSKFSIKK